MGQVEDSEARIVAAFVERFYRDAELGRRARLVDYLLEFPDAQEAVAREYLELLRVEQGEDEPESEERKTVGRYRLVRPLGRGGQGVVWLAEDPRLDRRVALKVLHPSSLTSDDELERFQREAAIASRLSHPGICAVYDTGHEDGASYIAMQYVPGRPLSEWIRERSSSTRTPAKAGADAEGPATLVPGRADDARRGLREPTTTGAITDRREIHAALETFEQVAQALHAAHQAGIVHRDIKPQNIMLRPDGGPVILDFGIARSLDGGLATLTRTGAVFGTPAYMAPEQVEGRRVDHRCDVYSLGATLYECVTLRRPFEASTHERLFHEVLHATPQSPRSLNPRLPPELSVVLETALRKDPARRYETAADFADDLLRIRNSRPIAARVPTLWVRAFLWARRHRALAASLCAALFFLVAGLATSLVFLGRARDRAREAAEERGHARERLREFEQMSDASLALRLIDDERRLWPRRPESVPAMDAWLGRVDLLLAREEAHRRARERLLEAAPPYTDAERTADEPRRREHHPRLYAQIDAEREAVRLLEARRSRAVAALAALKDSSAEGAPLAEARRELEVTEELRELHVGKLGDLEADPRATARLDLGVGEELREWRYDVLTSLTRDLTRLHALRAAVEERRRVAAELERVTIEEARDAWDTCLADIRTSPRYARNAALAAGPYAGWLAEMRPRPGLIPLGRDQRSGLWEFWLAESGERPAWVAGDGVAGHLDFRAYGGAAGIVLVLLPGGSFRIGCDADDGMATAGEVPLQRIELAPFFFSKFEINQGQWTRAAGFNPSRFRPGIYEESPVKVETLSLALPVTNVNHDEVVEVARRLGLEVPTEAQWEYAARGGTTTKWWTGDDPADIFEKNAGNVNDETWRDASGRRRDDGNPLFAPCGFYAPNPFGLHETIGNVSEWTRDRLGRYGGAVAPHDGLRLDVVGGDFVFRGGSFRTTPDLARSSQRRAGSAQMETADLGARFGLTLRH